MTEPLNQALRIGILARSGYGKTRLVRQLIPMASKQMPNVLFIYYNTDFENLPELKGLKNVKIFTPDKEKNDDLKYLNDFILNIRSKYSNVMLIIDDIDLFFDGNSSLSLKSKELKQLFSNGRHQRIGCIWISKQLAFIPKKIISNTDLFYLGNFVEQQDLERLKGFVDTKQIVKLTDPIFMRYDRRVVPSERVKYIKGW